jgi:hypothetical protein
MYSFCQVLLFSLAWHMCSLRNTKKSNESTFKGKTAKLDMFNDKNLRLYNHVGDHRGRDRMVVGFTTTYAISAYHH